MIMAQVNIQSRIELLKEEVLQINEQAEPDTFREILEEIAELEQLKTMYR